MKKKITPEKKCLLILTGFSLVALLVLLPISIVLKIWGLTIGWVLGCLATLLNTFLLFKSGNAISDSAKSEKGVGISVLFFFFRFLIIGAVLVLCAILWYMYGIGVFEWSVFTCAASVLPSSLIIVIFYRSNDEVVEVKK